MTIAEAVEKLKTLPPQKQEEALRFIESLEPDAAEAECDRNQRIEALLADMRRGCFEKVVPYTREELNERHPH